MSGKRYTFEAVRTALMGHWGLTLHRGGEMSDGDPRHTGRWDTVYSRTGFVVGGDLPRRGHGYQRYTSLARVVTAWDLTEVLSDARRAG